LTEYLNKHLIFYINTNFFVALAVLCLHLSSEILLGNSNYEVSIFIFFATILTYNFQRLVIIQKGIENKKSSWIKENKKIIYLLSILSFVITFFLFLNFKPQTQIVIIFCGIISFLYPFLLRSIPYLKIFIISIVWTLISLTLLVIENELFIDQNICYLHMSRFCFVFAITIPFDIRDILIDFKNIKTIPVIFGEKRSKYISVIFLFLNQLIFLKLYLLKFISNEMFHGMVILFCFTTVLIMQSRSNRKDIYFSFVVESTSVLMYIILFFSSCIV
tara:strand:- start:7861 stop:8685 length:825 start_codon:yes stop_codon:yes gene_type:complete